jgi:S-DNA-T family DNA segregation ATPase FtsK/SpoIIIE
LLVDSLNQRKSLFAQVGASNLEAYRRVSKKVMPTIIVMVDNFAPIREMYPDIESTFVKLAREGSGCGIYIVVTAASLSGNISYNLSQNFKQALSLRMTEKADYRDIVGNTEGLEPAKVSGRGLVRGKPPMEFQTALAVEASDDAEYVVKIKQRCEQIASEWNGELPREIPVMPDVVLPTHVKSSPPDSIAIGLSSDDILPICLAEDNRIVLISGTESSGKTNMLRVIAKHFSNEQSGVFIVSVKNDDNAPKQISEAIRKAIDGEKITLIIDGITGWLSQADYEKTDPLENLIGDMKNNQFSLFAAGDSSEISRSGHSVIQKMIASGASILLGGCFNDHYSQFEANNLGYAQQNEQLGPHCGYFIQKRKAVAFKAIYAGGW